MGTSGKFNNGNFLMLREDITNEWVRTMEYDISKNNRIKDIMEKTYEIISRNKRKFENFNEIILNQL